MRSCAAAVLVFASLASCGGGSSTPRTEESTESSVLSQDDAHLLAPASTAFAAQVTSAPADKAVISGPVRLVVKGSNLANVELLPSQGYEPKHAVFDISADKTTATTMLDTAKLPNGPMVVRISAFDAPAGSATAREIVAMPARTWIVRNQVAPGSFTARVAEAPANGATLHGPVRLVVTGTNLQNVELLPPSGYSPKYAVFTISGDRTRAVANLDTTKLPNGSLAARISAFNTPAGSAAAREIVAMPTRTWRISNGGDGGAWRIAGLGQLSVSETTGRVLNEAGEVIGTIGSHGYKYRSGRLIDLGSLGGGSSYPRAINNSGQVVGSSAVAGGSYRAFLYQGGVMTNLGRRVNPGASSIGQDINDNGDIVLTVADRPFLYARNGAVRSLDYLRHRYTRSMAINNSGQIVLNYDMKYSTAVLFSHGNALNLALSIGSPSPSHAAYGMNNYGDVIGISNGHAFWYSNGSMTDISRLGTGIFPYAINDGRQIVGMASRMGVNYAFLYSHGRLIDLNSLPDVQRAGWRLENAVAINNRGQIVGQGIDRSGQRRAFLLTPP